jgi:hypothetical protein
MAREALWVGETCKDIDARINTIVYSHKLSISWAGIWMRIFTPFQRRTSAASHVVVDLVDLSPCRSRHSSRRAMWLLIWSTSVLAQMVPWLIALFSSVIVPNLVGASGVIAANFISEIVLFDRARVVNSIMGIFFIQSLRRR